MRSLVRSRILALSSLGQPDFRTGLHVTARCPRLPAYSVLKERHDNSFSRCGCYPMLSHQTNDAARRTTGNQATFLQKLATMRTAPRLRLHYIWDSHNFCSRQAPIPSFMNLDLFLRQHMLWTYFWDYNVRRIPFSATRQASTERC
jgi:hypothetical protein